MKAVNKIYITGIQFREAPLVNPVYSRPFVLELNDTNDLNNLTGKQPDLFGIADTANSSAANILPYDVAQIAPNFVSLAAPVTVSDIPNGYDSRRCSFILNALIEYRDNSREGVTIEGYTHDMAIRGKQGAGAGKGHSLNHNQVLFMVSVKTVKLSNKVTPGTQYGKVTGVTNVLLPDAVRKENTSNIGGVLNNISSSWTAQRPTDMFSSLMLRSTEEEVGTPILDLTNNLGLESLGVSVAATSPAGFTATVVNSYSNAVADIALDGNSSFGELSPGLYSSCHNRASSNTLSSNDLMMALRGVSENASRGNFTLTDILKVDPTFTSDRVLYYSMNNKDIADHRQYSSADHINSIPGEIAATTNMLINNFMLRADANLLSAVISNRSVDATVPYVIDVLKVGCLEANKAPIAGRGLYKMIKDELCPMLSEKFDESWLIEITAITIKETMVTVRCDGHEDVYKVYPTYASTASSPVLVPPNIDTGMVGGFSKLIDLIGIEDTEVDAGYIDTGSLTFNDTPADSQGVSNY